MAQFGMVLCGVQWYVVMAMTCGPTMVLLGLDHLALEPLLSNSRRAFYASSLYFTEDGCCVCRYHHQIYHIISCHMGDQVESCHRADVRSVSLWLLIMWGGPTVHNVLSSLRDFSKRDHQNVIWERQVCSKRPLLKTIRLRKLNKCPTLKLCILLQSWKISPRVLLQSSGAWECWCCNCM